MKKLILSIILTLSVFAAQAKSHSYKSWKKEESGLLYCSAMAYGGYNFLEKAPLGGISLGLNAFCVRVELDFGRSSLEMPPPVSAKSVKPGRRNLTYFNPSVGLAFGDKYEFYAMIGFNLGCHSNG